MGFVNGIWLVVLGILGAASLIIAKKPDAKELIDKLAPYQGWIGAASAVWGVWVVISSVLHMATWLRFAPILWFTQLADGVLSIALGLLLGVGVLKTWIKDATAQAKMDETIKKIAPYQGTFGLIAIGLGLWMVVASVLWHVA